MKLVYTTTMIDSPEVSIVGLFKDDEKALAIFREHQGKDFGIEADGESDWRMTSIIDVNIPASIGDKVYAIVLITWLEYIDTVIEKLHGDLGQAVAHLQCIYKEKKENLHNLSEDNHGEISFHIADDSVMVDEYGHIEEIFVS